MAPLDSNGQVAIAVIQKVLNDAVAQAGGQSGTAKIPHFPETAEVQICDIGFDDVCHGLYPEKGQSGIISKRQKPRNDHSKG